MEINQNKAAANQEPKRGRPATKKETKKETQATTTETGADETPTTTTETGADETPTANKPLRSGIVAPRGLVPTGVHRNKEAREFTTLKNLRTGISCALPAKYAQRLISSNPNLYVAAE